MKLTRQQAIKAKCEDCIYDPMTGGTNLAQIEDCPSDDCALWEYRPLTSATRAVQKQKQIELMSEGERMAYEKKADRMRVQASGRAV